MEIRVIRFEAGGSASEAVVGTAEIEIGPIRIRNVRLVRRRDGSGYFVGWPARKDRESGEWTDMVYIPDRSLYDKAIEVLAQASQSAVEPSGPVDGEREDVPF